MAIASQAQTLTTLASFSGAIQAQPNQPNVLIQATDGNFYGTTLQGGLITTLSPNGNGTIFKLTPAGVLTTLYTFGTVLNDGAMPTSLIQGGDGNFYGTTYYNAMGAFGIAGKGTDFGTIFKVTLAGKLTTLYTFCPKGEPCIDSQYPTSLTLGADGTIYGTTIGPQLGGSFFKITPTGILTTLYGFGRGQTTQGSNPVGPLIQTSDGNFYGTASGDGILPCGSFVLGCGTVFKITPGGTLTKLYTFGTTPTDGANPRSSLVLATDGNFYGTTAAGGATGDGTVFRITPSGALTTLYSFAHGCSPTGDLVQAGDGGLYGTNGCGPTVPAGTIFRIALDGTFTTPYDFCAQPNCNDGRGPSWLIQGSDGNLYGTTQAGGVNGDGSIFEFSLASANSPAIAANAGVVNGASFQPGAVPGSWITIEGKNLSSKTDGWDKAIVNSVLPTSLDGVQVTVGTQPAYIAYISPAQINALVPNVATGTMPVTVTSSGLTSQAVNVQIQSAQPAFFQWGNYAVATRQDYSLAVKAGTFPGATTVAAKPGDVIILWGTGFGPTSPAAPAGVQVPANTTYNTATAVSVTVGGKSALVYGAALASGFVGLYQVAIQIPTSLTDGDYPVIASISDVQSPATTLITVQQ